VRRKAVADRIRKPVDERDVAEHVALAEVRTVRLEGVQPVRRKDHDRAARLRDANGLRDRLAVVVDVLDHLVREDHVEVIVGKGERLAGCQVDVRQLQARLRDPVGLDVDAVHVVGVLAEAPHIRADAAADVEDTRTLERHEATHHLEAAVLAEAPAVTGTSALDRRGGMDVVVGLRSERQMSLICGADGRRGGEMLRNSNVSA